MSAKPTITPVSRLDKWVLRMSFKSYRVPVLGSLFWIWGRLNAKKYGRLDAMGGYLPK